MKPDWLKIAEYVSLAGAAIGAIAAILLSAAIYGAVLLFLSLWLNLIVRYRWHQINQERIIHATIALESLLADIRTAIAERVEQMKMEMAAVDETAPNPPASDQNIENLILAIEQVQAEFSTLDESIAPVTEQLEILIATVKDYSVSAQQVETWQQQLGEILTRLEERSHSDEALAQMMQFHQEIDRWIAELKELRAISAESVTQGLASEPIAADSSVDTSMVDEPVTPIEESAIGVTGQTVAPTDAATSESEFIQSELPNSPPLPKSDDRELSEDRDLAEHSQPSDEKREDPELDDREPSPEIESGRANPDDADLDSQLVPESGEKTGQLVREQPASEPAEISTEPIAVDRHLALTHPEPYRQPEMAQLMAPTGAFPHHPSVWQGYEPAPESQLLAFNQFNYPQPASSETPPNLDLSHTNLSGVSLTGANLAGATLIQANLSQTDLSGADLRGANLSGADLSGATLDEADLEAANLTAANLIGVNLRTVDLRGANLSGANLAGQNLSGLNLSNLDLISANLQGANLSTTNLSGSRLITANLQNANLSAANLELANLSGANLTGAEISQTNFGEGERLANLTDAIMPE